MILQYLSLLSCPSFLLLSAQLTSFVTSLPYWEVCITMKPNNSDALVNDPLFNEIVT